MEKRPVEFNLFEWLILTDLVKATPRKYQDKDHKGTDVYNLIKLRQGCTNPFWDVGQTERKQRGSLNTKLKKYTDDGYRFIEFKPFDDQGDSLD